jgi:mono/diheme cytochrome c family protein
MKKTIPVLGMIVIACCFIGNFTGCYYDKEVTTCTDTASSYTTHIKPIIEANCATCHGANNPGGNHDYSKWQGLNEVALNGLLTGAITHAPGFSPMPKNRAKLSDCQVNQIKRWINAGAPNN